MTGEDDFWKDVHAVEIKYKPGEFDGRDTADVESFNRAIEVLEEADRYEVDKIDEGLGMAIGATEDYDELKSFMRGTDLYVESHDDLTDQ